VNTQKSSKNQQLSFIIHVLRMSQMRKVHIDNTEI